MKFEESKPSIVSKRESKVEDKNDGVSFGTIRKVLRYHKRKSERRRRTDDGYYRVNRLNASQYFFFDNNEFGIQSEWRKQVTSFFHQVHDQGQKVVYLDLCGEASARSLGADVSYTFSFQPYFTSELTNVIHPGVQKSDGDIFSLRDFSQMLQLIRDKGERLSLVTFDPIVGLQTHTPSHENKDEKAVIYGILEQRLRKVVELMVPGGFVYIGRPFQIDGLTDFLLKKRQSESDLSLHLQKIAASLKCSIEIAEVLTGPYFLLRKNKEGKVFMPKVTVCKPRLRRHR